MRFLLLILLLFAATPTRAEAPQDIAYTSRQGPILYGTAWCPYCKAARSWFRANNIAFTNCDVETNATCKKQFASLRKQYDVSGVPLIAYQGEVWSGYDEEQMEDIAALYAKGTNRLKLGR